MTARIGKARGYFSQLAEPVPQSAPVFSARRDLSAPSAHISPPIPVIDDVVYHESEPPRTRLQLSPIMQTPELRNEKPVEKPEPASAPRPASEITTVQSSTRRNQDSESALTGAYQRPSSATRNMAERLEQSTRRNIDFGSNEGRRNSKLNDMRPATDKREALSLSESGVQASAEHSSKADTARGAIILAKEAPGAPSFATALNDHPVQRRTIRSESRRSVASVHSISPESAQNFGPEMPDTKRSNVPSNLLNNQKTSGNASANANHESVKRGTKVVIGTVEIRTRIAQPAPIATPPVQRIPDRNSDQANLHGGERPARLDSLVRSLGWNFGLIQG
jgi:hypothetical protein